MRLFLCGAGNSKVPRGYYIAYLTWIPDPSGSVNVLLADVSNDFQNSDSMALRPGCLTADSAAKALEQAYWKVLKRRLSRQGPEILTFSESLRGEA